MPTARDQELRQVLGQVFHPSAMLRVWRRTVRLGLRRQRLPDLHDYYDFNTGAEVHIDRIRSSILNGTYRPSAPTIVRQEKQNGLCRRLAVPSPDDALVLQTVVEYLEQRILAQQPTRSAFYSRSHTGPNVQDIDETFPYSIWELWPEFQRRIWRFTEDRQYIVITDVANYFDCIPLSALRNILASVTNVNEGVLDFLFFTLEAFVWRPYYTALTGVGLPQIDFDAPRLLAHAFLFVIDREIDTATQGNFVRWMDDINFAVDSIEEAKRTLGRVEHLLNSYGLRLNSGKTKILPSEVAASHFWIQENRELNIIKNAITNGVQSTESRERWANYLRNRYSIFSGYAHDGQHSKVLKRYFNLFGKLNDAHLDFLVPAVVEQDANLRETALRYWETLGFTTRRFNWLLDCIGSGRCLDDASLIQVADVFVSWEISPASRERAVLVNMATNLSRSYPNSETAVVSGLRILCKYATRLELENFLSETRDTWNRSDWVARQVAAATPRVGSSAVAGIARLITACGLRDALNVLAHLKQLKSVEAPDHALWTYLTHDHRPHPYPLHKVLISLAVLEGAISTPAGERLSNRLSETIVDPIYRDLLNISPRNLSLVTHPQ